MSLHRTKPSTTSGELPDPADFQAFHPFLKGVFSQWHPTPFHLIGQRFSTAEQWMMFCKAKLFEDEAVAGAIMNTDDPAHQKRLGQTVSGFDQDRWEEWKVDIVSEGNRAKFSQNPGALRQLFGTHPTMLVEANPRDWVWGAGLAADDPAIGNPVQWRGANLLGRILTAMRIDSRRDIRNRIQPVMTTASL